MNKNDVSVKVRREHCFTAFSSTTFLRAANRCCSLSSSATDIPEPRFVYLKLNFYNEGYTVQ